MLSRAFTKRRRSIKDGEHTKFSRSIHEYDDYIVGFTYDLPLISCENRGVQMTMKEVLRSSVGVMGESSLGMTEKVVLLNGEMFAVKRFRKLIVGRSEFGRRVEKLAQLSRKCEYLVPITAYLYAKRIKFILCDYYPMGSLADLLACGRKHGHTALNWNQRLKIILQVARAIFFIHTECPANERNMQMSVHGNIKSSNVMINIDFSACLSDYGFTQLAERLEVYGASQTKPPSLSEYIYNEDLSQKSDLFDFGVVVMDILAGSRFPWLKTKCILENKEDIKEGKIEFFEFTVEGKERKRAMQVLDIALACTNRLPEARPSIEQVLLFLGDVINK
ncbi:putative Leucine-rich repeat protein kinase family protein [Melia azedarach]|uniref:Leucine-rich repeat protein kinase family protein n=1 Tax=Melia azedarach TaxID=155640 RepID=A0ACC1XLX5_MELAZ|nr:putative Leucine-rich repeat protein kinase family protein [Melia azedarach]